MPQPASSPSGGIPAVSVRPVRGHDGTSVILSLDAALPWERLRDEIVRVLGQTPDRWRHGTARLDLGDRDLELFDVRRLVHLLRDEFSLSVTGLYSSERALHRYVARELKLQVFVRDPSGDWTADELARVGEEEDPTRPAGHVDVVVLDQVGDADEGTGSDAGEVTRQTELSRPAAAEDAETALRVDPTAAAVEDPSEVVFEVPPSLLVEPTPVSFQGGRRLLPVHRTLRGGQRIAFPGDVLVWGDVNPGATVEAGGNILVLGSLRGLAHAGVHGDERAVIVAFDLRPTQLRIATRIAFPREGSREDGGRGPRPFRPEIAWVKGEDILIEDYAGRLPGPPSLVVHPPQPAAPPVEPVEPPTVLDHTE